MKFELDILRMAHELASHASARHALIARNTANADTQGYRARDLRPFSDVFVDAAGFSPRVTRTGHIAGAATAGARDTIETSVFGAASPNGNTVSLEDQMVRAADVGRQHALALGVYRKSMEILRLGLGRGR
ncbi:MAG: FlgB family protein [Paracoccaceae bacterium]